MFSYILTIAGVEHHRVCKIFPENIWRKLFLVMICEEEDVGDNQADDDKRLQSDQTSQIIHLFCNIDEETDFFL